MSSFSPSSKIICGSLLLGIALASLLNLASRPIRTYSVSDIDAKRSGYRSAEDMVASSQRVKEVFGEDLKALTKGKPHGLSADKYAEAEKLLRNGSTGTKRIVILTVAHAGYTYGKTGPTGYTPGEMPPEAMRLLTAQASSPSPEIRMTTAHAIAWCKDPPVRALFAQLGNDPDPKVSGYVNNYLREEAQDKQGTKSAKVQR